LAKTLGRIIYQKLPEFLKQNQEIKNKEEEYKNKVKEYFNSLPDDQKDIFIGRLAKVVELSKTTTLDSKLLKEDPWATKKSTVISSLNYSEVNDSVFSTVLEVLKDDEILGVDVSAQRLKVINDNYNILLDNGNYDTEKLNSTTERLKNLPSSFSLKDFIDKAYFTSLANAIDKKGENQNNQIIMNFLGKNSFWEHLPKPLDLVRRFGPRTKLRQKFPILAKGVYESWHSK